MASKKSEPKQEVESSPLKMRIRLLSEGGVVHSDRLVSQSTELAKGPSEAWKKGYQIEFCLMDKEDTELAIKYLQQLSGDLPINTVKEKKIAKKATSKLLDKEPIKELVHTALAKSKDQQELMEYLRGVGFVFLTHQFIQDFKIPIQISKSKVQYQYMVRALKIGKNPKSDKYDPQLAFGFRLGVSKNKKVKIFMYGKFYKKALLPWSLSPDKAVNFKKPEMLKYPAYMLEEERIRFSIEHRQLHQKPDKKPSKFYLRWKDFVKIK